MYAQATRANRHGYEWRRTDGSHTEFSMYVEIMLVVRTFSHRQAHAHMPCCHRMCMLATHAWRMRLLRICAYGGTCM
jgi:hypothetical protein